jgi:hypothetical protein
MELRVCFSSAIAIPHQHHRLAQIDEGADIPSGSAIQRLV